MTELDQTATSRPPFLGRRLLVFFVLGVPLGNIVLLLALPVVMTGALDLAAAYTDPWSLPLIAILPPAWFIGGLPALLTGGFDYILARRSIRPARRALLTALFGTVLTLLPVTFYYLSDLIHGALPLLVGLAGLVAGAVCSTLAALLDRP